MSWSLRVAITGGRRRAPAGAYPWGIAGAATGVITEVVAAHGIGNAWAGGFGGGVVGSMVGMGVTNATKPREWNLIAVK